MELNNHDAHCIDWYRRLVADGTAEDGQRIAVALYDENATLIAEVERLTKIVNAYAQSERTIALCLDKFCNRSLPYDEMIADAARKADQQIATLKKALELACEDLAERDYPPKNVESGKNKFVEYFIQQAQEQEGVK